MKRDTLVRTLVVLNVLLISYVVVRETGLAPRMSAESTAHAAAVPTKADAIARRTDIVVAAEKVSPAIVSIGASQTGYLLSPFASFFSDFAVYPYQQKIPYLGSGVIVSSDGIIVTNHHVVENASDVFVTLMDGREMPARLLDADIVLDIALLKIDAKNLPAVRIGDSDQLMVGEWVLAMGNPFGNLIGDPHPTVTAGVVSAVKRSFRPSSEMQRVYQDMIQTDAAINPGNSGGALINAAGELIGISTFIMSRSGGAEGVGFAIPANRVKMVIEEILTHDRIRSRLMDFQVLNLNERIAARVGAKVAKGAVVSEVVRGGPADAAGLRTGDVIVMVDGRPVKDAQDFSLYLWTKPVGTVVKMEIDRGGKRLQVEYELTEARGR